MVKATVACVWLLSWLPFKAISALGWLVGHLIASIPSSRRHIGRVNLRRCLPDWTEADRSRLLLATSSPWFRCCWSTGTAGLHRPNACAPDEHRRPGASEQHEGRPVILMMPHFTGLDLAGLRVSPETELVSIYSRQKGPWLDEFFRTRRLRLGRHHLLATARHTRRHSRAAGRLLAVLPDQISGTATQDFRTLLRCERRNHHRPLTDGHGRWRGSTCLTTHGARLPATFGH